MVSSLSRLAGTVALAIAPVFYLATEALADRRMATPEIDGPAGVAAVALLVSAGLIAYRRFKK